MIDRIRFEKQLYQIEKRLNNWSVLPLLGSISALVKASLGTFQLVSALVIVILTALPALFNRKAKNLFFYSWTHIKHGIANLIGGLIMAIPCGGAIVYLIANCAAPKRNDLHVDVGQDFHFLLYYNHVFSEGHLTYNDQHQCCGINAWTFDDKDDFFPLFEGMSTAEAMNIGLLNANLQINENVFYHIRKDYEADRLMIRGMLKSQRQKKYPEEKNQECKQPTAKFTARGGFGLKHHGLQN